MFAGIADSPRPKASRCGPWQHLRVVFRCNTEELIFEANLPGKDEVRLGAIVEGYDKEGVLSAGSDSSLDQMIDSPSPFRLKRS